MSDVITTRQKSLIPELYLRLVRAAVQVSLFFFAFGFWLLLAHKRR
jgi:hypothetical protein